MGLNDPRTYGSGNPGATNVLRSGSKAAAALTLLLDAFKGLVPVLLVKYFGPDFGLQEGTLALVIPADLAGLYGERPAGRLAQLATIINRRLVLAVEGGPSVTVK